MINSEESERLFRQLADALRAAGMVWIVDEVYDHIAAGKGLQPVVVKFPKRATRVSRGEDEELDRARPGFTGRIEFTPQERLRLLVESAVSVVRDCVDMDDALTKEFGRIDFLPEVPEEAERSFRIGHPEQPRRESIAVLERLVGEFVAELEE